MKVLERFLSFYQTLSPKELGALDTIYSDDVVFIDPVTSHSGLDAVKQYFAKLLANCRGCAFDIHAATLNGASGYVRWTMTFEHPRLRRGRPISVDGFSLLNFEAGKISEQRDYYDMGAMIYEHVPLLGGIVSGLRRRLAA